MYLEIMKNWISFFLIALSVSCFGQNAVEANELFKKGDFTEALKIYQSLLDKSPKSYSYTTRAIECFQQLERYQDAEALINKTMQTNNSKALLVYLGYNYLLMGNKALAESTFLSSQESIIKNTNNVYVVARQFEQFGLINQAVKAYEIATNQSNNPNFQLNLARLYGEQGNINLMLDTYITFLKTDPNSLNTIKVRLHPFISKSKSDENNLALREKLIVKIQEEQDINYNKLLSWLYLKEEQYKKAFIQEKAILNREASNFYQLVELARLTESAEQFNLAISIYTYIIERSPSNDMRLFANQKLLNIKVNNSGSEDYPQLANEYETLISGQLQNPAIVPLVNDYANFLCFKLKNPTKAITLLEENLKIDHSITDVAQVKLTLGDILVYQERFDEALMFYTQVQIALKNSPVAQEARFRVARTSFYKGDFKWAETQLKVLKSSVSQLIANDALDLKLIISDHKYDDSLQVALKSYAKASLLEFQNKPDKAIETLTYITDNHKEEAIVDNALFKMASIYEKQKDFNKASAIYQKIIATYKESILLDDCYFRLGYLNETYLNNPELAKTYYEFIIFNLEDSIHFVESRNRYRALSTNI